jgi:hypothetical protein
MNCEQFQSVVQDLARNEWLDVATTKDALEHADACSACDELLQEAEALTAGLHALAALDSSEQASGQVERKVLDAFSRKKSAALRRSNLRIATVAALSCAAALALFALLLLHRGRPWSAPQGARPAAPSAPTANATNGRQQAFVVESGGLGTAPSDALSAFEEEDDAAGAFVPLTKSFDPASLDGGAVVRVEMSRTALQQFGLSPSQNNNQPVLADMVVTGDGRPQAIRLVGK